MTLTADAPIEVVLTEAVEQLADAQDTIAGGVKSRDDRLERVAEALDRQTEALRTTVVEVRFPESTGIVEGKRGEPGVQGAPGFTGAMGAQGKPGPAGADGTNGRNGIDGMPGADGIDGRDGAKGLNWRGPFVRRRRYAPDDAVESGGSSYVAVAATSTQPPGAGWELLAQRGSDGRPGRNGVGGGGGGTGSLTVLDEGVSQGAATSLDFAGAGVSVATVAGVSTVTVPGGGTLAAVLTADNHTDGTPIVANVPDDFADVLLVETPDTGDLTSNGYVLRVHDTANDHHILDVDAWGSVLIRGPFNPGSGSGGFDIVRQSDDSHVGTFDTRGTFVVQGLATDAMGSMAFVEDVVLLRGDRSGLGAGGPGIGFFDKAGAASASLPAQQTAASIADLWAALNAYGLLDDASVAPTVGGTPAADPGDIADPTLATAEDVALKLNALMAAMRTAGSLA